jgi:Tfp pilus assembly protein PilO
VTRNRLSLLLAVLAMFVVAAAGYFLAVQPQLAQAADAHAQRATVEQTNASSQTELSRLRQQAKSLPQMKARLAALSESVPDDAALPSFIDELNATASAAGVEVQSYATDDAAAYAPTASTTATSTAATGEATSVPSATATPTPTAAPSTAAEPSLVTDPAVTAQNFSVVPAAVAVDGTYDQALAFVKGLQSGKRLFLITKISSAEDSGSESDATGVSTWMFGGSLYVLDRSTDAAAPSSAATATPSASATPAANG